MSKLFVTYRKSGIGYRQSQKDTLRIVQTAELAIEFGEAGCDARDLAVTFEGGSGGLNRVGEGVVERLEALSAGTAFGEREQFALGVLDLDLAGLFDVAFGRL